MKNLPPTAPLSRRSGLELLAASFGALALEMALIRWLPGQVRVVSYFPNLVLIAAFLGLGLGALGKVRWTFAGGALALATVGSAVGLSRIAFTQSATKFGSAIRQAPKAPFCTRSDGHPQFRLISS